MPKQKSPLAVRPRGKRKGPDKYLPKPKFQINVAFSECVYRNSF